MTRRHSVVGTCWLLVILAISHCGGSSSSSSSSPTPTPTPTPTSPSPSPATGPADLMKVAVLIDARAPQTPRGDVDRVFARAAQRLLEKTGESMSSVEVTYGPAGATTSDIVTRYLAAK